MNVLPKEKVSVGNISEIARRVVIAGQFLTASPVAVLTTAVIGALPAVGVGVLMHGEIVGGLLLQAPLSFLPFTYAMARSEFAWKHGSARRPVTGASGIDPESCSQPR